MSLSHALARKVPLEREAVVEGIDISPAMVNLAIRSYPAARFQVGDCEDMRYADDVFDAVVCNLGLHHLTSPGRGVAEFARVLGPAGRLSLTVWDENRSALALIPEAIAAAGAVAPDDLPTPPDAPDLRQRRRTGTTPGRGGASAGVGRTVLFLQRYLSPQALWDGWLAAAIRTGPLFAAQTEPVKEAARRGFDDLVAPYLEVDGAVALPVGFLVITAAT